MGADLAAVARLLASPARAAMVEALLEGQSFSASELAVIGSVGASAASEHLAALVKGNLVVVSQDGRFRRYELAGKRIATALEAFSLICPPSRVSSLRQASKSEAFRAARTCYDHLAGRLAVALLHSLLLRRWLVPSERGYLLTESGEGALRSIGVKINPNRQRRAFARSCLDSTERRPHLGGALGAAVTTTLLDRGWLRRRPGGRGLEITRTGQIGLSQVFGLDRFAEGVPVDSRQRRIVSPKP